MSPQILIELSTYTIDLLFCIFMIRGAFKVRKKNFKIFKNFKKILIDEENLGSFVDNSFILSSL